MSRIIPDERGSVELNPARFDALRNLCIAARFVAETQTSTPPPSADLHPTLKELEKIAYIKAYQKTGSVQGVAREMDVSVGTAYNRFQQFRIKPMKIAKNLIKLVACAVLCVGCTTSKPKAEITTPPLPPIVESAMAKASATRAAIAPAPQKITTITWSGGGKGWIATVSFKRTLEEPWRVAGYATNQNWYSEPAIEPHGFYAVTKLVDVENPNNVWIGK